MGFGCVCVPKQAARNIALRLRDIKCRNSCTQELKWTKVSPKNIGFYKEVSDYFFETDSLRFRSLVVENKSMLDHDSYNLGSHETFYYKMYYTLLKNIIDKRSSGDTYTIYFDIKDTKGSLRIRELQKILSNSLHDFDHSVIRRMQIVRSNEIEPLQLCDFLLGAVMYKSRHLDTSHAKLEIVSHIENRSGYNLAFSNEPWQNKFNLFHFMPSHRK